MERSLQIDILKGLAIIGVLLQHMLSDMFFHDSYAAFHIKQAVPIFVILMSYNLGLSFKRRHYRTP